MVKRQMKEAPKSLTARQIENLKTCVIDVMDAKAAVKYAQGIVEAKNVERNKAEQRLRKLRILSGNHVLDIDGMMFAVFAAEDGHVVHCDYIGRVLVSYKKT